MDKYNTIVLSHYFKTKNHEYRFTECFKPFSGKEISENEYFINNYRESRIPISDTNNYDVKKYLAEYCEGNTLISNIEPNFSNIVLDMIFTLYFCFFRDERKLFHEKYYPNLWNMNSVYYIGIYTELLKNKVNEMKTDISIILNILSNDALSSDEKNRSINIVFSKYSVNRLVNNINSIRTGLLKILSSCSHNNSTACEIDIDFSLFDHFIQLLENFNFKKYIYKESCFCLANENTNYFFSLSGVCREPDEILFKRIKEGIIDIAKNEFNLTISIDYCRVSDNTLSYGRKDSNGTFISFKSMNLKTPISYGKYDENLYLEKKIDSFTCCERKLFAGMQLSGKITLYCKYEPCIRCIPSINDNIKKYSCLKFYAFAKDSTACMEMIINNQKQILSTKNYDYYRCI